jgi:hypothetical protein
VRKRSTRSPGSIQVAAQRGRKGIQRTGGTTLSTQFDHQPGVHRFSQQYIEIEAQRGLDRSLERRRAEQQKAKRTKWIWLVVGLIFLACVIAAAAMFL